MNVLVVHYAHPEGYPPAFNAINSISEKVNHVTVLTTDTLPSCWEYSENVDFKLLQGEHDRFKFASRSKIQKLNTYINFIQNIKKIRKKDGIGLILIYDRIPFLLFVISNFLNVSKVKVWYHSHDVYPSSRYKFFSINWLATLAVQKFFNRIDYFSLPALERKYMFPLKKFKGKTYYIPNYPSKRIIKKRVWGETNRISTEKEFKIVYPGSPSLKNGFEELLDCIKEMNDLFITLTIVGEVNKKYKKELELKAHDLGVSDRLLFKGRIPYIRMPDYIRTFDIGWAVYKPLDVSVATAGSSSNKIYEFFANGLPIVVYDNKNHRDHLKIAKAAFFTDLSRDSIVNNLRSIISDLQNLSRLARSDFESNFQFETKFYKVWEHISNDLG